MIDQPQRAVPRFPPEMVPQITRMLLQQLQVLEVGPDDLTISGAACGGDLLFVEAALAMGLRSELFLHTSIDQHIEQALRYAGSQWIEMFEQVRHHPRVRIHLLPERRDRPQKEPNPFVANNLWMMETALGLGAERLHGVLLWNGEGEDAPGGTAGMKSQLEAAGASVSVVWPEN